MSEMPMSSKQPELSVIVPVGGRTDDLAELHADYRSGLDVSGFTYEMIYVIDGARGEASRALLGLGEPPERLRILQLAKSFGESTALMTGFAAARGSKLMVLPAYFQVRGSELGKLLAASKEADMVIGHRWPRRGHLLDRLRRAGFHGMLKAVTGARFRDLGCAVRVMGRHVAEEINLYGDQHRLLPVLAARQGFRVLEVNVQQSPRDAFRGRYRIREYFHRVLDVLTVFFLVRFTKKPLRFFGMIGSATFGIGALATAILVAQRIWFDVPLADRPALLLACLFLVLGVQLFALGLLGELIIFTHARELREYRVANIVEAGFKEPGQRERAAEGPRLSGAG